MVYASLIVPDNVPRDFLDQAFEEGIVDIVYPTDPHAAFDRPEPCACTTPDKLAVRGRTIFVKKGHHEASAFPHYALPKDCTIEETYVIVTWLVRNSWKSFRARVVREKVKKNGKVEEVMHFRRTLETNIWFRVSSTDENCCDRYTLIRDPVFFARQLVLSPFGKGPVVECCVQNKAHE